jgi:hypothetical protein
MNRGIRAAIVAAVAAAVLAAAAVASAANTATVAVSSVGTSTTIHVNVPQTTDPIAAITFFIPAGWSANLGAAVGSTIGTVSAQANGHDVGLTLPLSGNVSVASPTAAAGDVCSPGTHGAIWNLNLSVAGQTLVLPIYVDQTNAATAGLGPYQMRICLPPWDVPVGTPGRAFEGAQLLDASFTVTNVFTAPTAGLSVWNNLFTPYFAGKGLPNVAATFDARSLVGAPSLSIKVAKKAKTYAAGGKLTEGGTPVSGAAVTLLRGTSATKLAKFASATTNAAGSWAKTGKTAGKVTYFKATATVKERDATTTGCAQPLPASIAPGGCVSATLGAWSATSPVAKFKP